MLGKYSVYTVLPAQDIARAEKFYAEKLGFSKLEDKDMQGMLMFKCGDSYLMVYETKYKPGGHTQAGFNVEDLEREIDELASRGVEMEHYDMPGLKTNEKGIVEWEGMKSAWFKDSEGNIIALNQKA